ncbi:hypothetical protein [Selenomonas bovis]|uniref:hypothetical protein n=1 Tax=Selenomonas bovis TaxID=416586 RepID=UPI0018CC3580|nr:hypothetical protein [Selenomonas bovis]
MGKEVGFYKFTPFCLQIRRYACFFIHPRQNGRGAIYDEGALLLGAVVWGTAPRQPYTNNPGFVVHSSHF